MTADVTEDVFAEDRDKIAPPIVIPYIPRPHFRAVACVVQSVGFPCCCASAGWQDCRACQSADSRGAYQIRDASAASLCVCWAELRPGEGFMLELPEALSGELSWDAVSRGRAHGDLSLRRDNPAVWRRVRLTSVMRGIYLDGAVLDEYPLLNPRAWTSVVRPTLGGLSRFCRHLGDVGNGDDHFHRRQLRAEDDPHGTSSTSRSPTRRKTRSVTRNKRS